MHFHGPKPGRGPYLDCLASRNATCLPRLPRVTSSQKSYRNRVAQGFQEDGGAMASAALGLYERTLQGTSGLCAEGG